MLGQSRSKFVDFVTNSRHISIEYFSMVYSWELGIKSQAEHDLFVCYLDLHFFLNEKGLSDWLIILSSYVKDIEHDSILMSGSQKAQKKTF